MQSPDALITRSDATTSAGGRRRQPDSNRPDAAGMYQAGVDTSGGVSVGMGQNDLPMPGFKLEGKIGLKYCQKF